MKYPNGIKKNFKVSNANRGMSLENDLNDSNKYYRDNNIAIIYKKPTPITVSKVDYKNNLITEGHYNIPSTTDYNGVYKGLYIDFEAKETRKDYFPLANIHEHQINHLEKINLCGGIGFIIVRFTLNKEDYLLEINKLLYFIKNNKRKSIPLKYFIDNGFLIKKSYNPYLDYLKIIDLLRSQK